MPSFSPRRWVSLSPLLLLLLLSLAHAHAQQHNNTTTTSTSTSTNSTRRGGLAGSLGNVAPDAFVSFPLNTPRSASSSSSQSTPPSNSRNPVTQTPNPSRIQSNPSNSNSNSLSFSQSSFLSFETATPTPSSSSSSSQSSQSLQSSSFQKSALSPTPSPDSSSIVPATSTFDSITTTSSPSLPSSTPESSAHHLSNSAVHSNLTSTPFNISSTPAPTNTSATSVSPLSASNPITTPFSSAASATPIPVPIHRSPSSTNKVKNGNNSHPDEPLTQVEPADPDSPYAPPKKTTVIFVSIIGSAVMLLGGMALILVRRSSDDWKVPLIMAELGKSDGNDKGGPNNGRDGSRHDTQPDLPPSLVHKILKESGQLDNSVAPRRKSLITRMFGFSLLQNLQGGLLPYHSDPKPTDPSQKTHQLNHQPSLDSISTRIKSESEPDTMATSRANKYRSSRTNSGMESRLWKAWKRVKKNHVGDHPDNDPQDEHDLSAEAVELPTMHRYSPDAAFDMDRIDVLSIATDSTGVTSTASNRPNEYGVRENRHGRKLTPSMSISNCGLSSDDEEGSVLRQIKEKFGVDLGDGLDTRDRHLSRKSEGLVVFAGMDLQTVETPTPLRYRDSASSYGFGSIDHDIRQGQSSYQSRSSDDSCTMRLDVDIVSEERIDPLNEKPRPISMSSISSMESAGSFVSEHSYITDSEFSPSSASEDELGYEMDSDVDLDLGESNMTNSFQFHRSSLHLRSLPPPPPFPTPETQVPVFLDTLPVSPTSFEVSPVSPKSPISPFSSLSAANSGTDTELDGELGWNQRDKVRSRILNHSGNHGNDHVETRETEVNLEEKEKDLPRNVIPRRF
ncbi:hypothetical protein BKA69DRAFT_1082508 [Paraphysoderma sedebokerense]|nr:hypothetical protein BKA69DRAFT_1082508 [Paraphysoderma sedebokerense]